MFKTGELLKRITVFILALGITLCTFGREVVTPVSAAGSEAYLTTGSNFNAKIKKLSGTTNASYSTTNNNIVSFQRSTEAPTATIATGSDGDISRDQDGSVVAWFDNGTIYWYADEDKVYLNPNSSNMFYYCEGLTSLDLSSFDTSNVTTMQNMFYGCEKLTTLDLSHFDTYNVTNMRRMFMSCTGLTSLDVSSFDTSNVTDMYQMFDSCRGLTSLNVSSFDTSNVTSMYDMFMSCLNLTTIYAGSGWNTDKVTFSGDMFYGDNKLVGGAGTTYNNSYTDKTYARIDKGETNPGYFTDAEYHLPDPAVEGLRWVIFNEPKHEFTLVKYSSYDKSQVEGATFHLWGISNNNTPVDQTVTSGFNGLLTFSGLESGVYMLQETEAPETVYLDETIRTVKIEQDGTVTIDGLTMGEIYNYFDVYNVTRRTKQIVVTKEWIADEGTKFPEINVHVSVEKPSAVDGDIITYNAAGGVFNNGQSTNNVIYKWNDSTSRNIVTGTVETPTREGYTFDGWYSDRVYETKVNASDYETRKLDGDIQLFAKWKEKEPAYLTTGWSFNVKIKKLSDTATTSFTTSNNNIVSFQRSAEAPVATIAARSDGDISRDQDGSVVAWFDNGTIYWYADEDKVYLNPNSSNMFYYCEGLTSLDLSSFDTSNVTRMDWMFRDCTGLTSLDLSSFDTSNVTNMGMMFYKCESLASLDVSSFDTSNVTYMGYMFERCTGLTSLDLSSFNTSKVTDMSSMFYDCTGLTSLDLSSFDTSKVTDMSSMFRDCESLASLDVSNFDTSNVTSMSHMFYYCQGLTSLDVSGFDTSKVTIMNRMFSFCSSLTSLDLSRFDTSKVTYMDDMFNNCQGLTSLDLSSFDTSKVTDMERMFFYCTGLTTIYVGSGWNTDKVTSSNSMFFADSKLVGGAGTTYSSPYDDKSRAKIDGGASNPGYFTAKN